MGAHIVTSDGLNLRSAPVVRPSNRIMVLKYGQKVTRIGEAADPAWWQVSVDLGGQTVTGYVARQYLTPVEQFSPPDAHTGVTAVHLGEGRLNVTRKVRDGGWRYPLGEPDRPGRTGTSSAERSNSIGRIVDWLDVEHSARYRPERATYCNIYAYDYCYLGGAYLPRVFWTRKAIQQLASGKSVAPVYGKSVEEQSANMLFDWLENFGADFGWTRTMSLDELQDVANAGGLGLICAQQKNPARSGHIVAVVPETESARATRSGRRVKYPLQSQAGRNNYRYIARGWWTGGEFREFGFWRHA